jgi:hypothetical protein
MLAKCTNPSCFHLFRHLDEGRLFRLETDPTAMLPSAGRVEYLWLCSRCSAAMTLLLSEDGRVIATGLREALRRGTQVAFVSVNHKKGLFLRGVSFLHDSDSREPHEDRIEARALVANDWEQRTDIVAAASSCPVPDCSLPVIEYRSAASIRPGHPEDWEFMCSRCGMEFTAAQSALIFQSVPKQWLSADIHAA